MTAIITIVAIILIGTAFVKESGSGTGKAIAIFVCVVLALFMLL